jgi:predicted nuclease of restriction endonuclease-like (RecB) superfamily
MLPEKSIEQLHQQITAVITTGKQTAYRAINAAMTLTYWEIGRLIVEEEQQGKDRADYGDYLIITLAKRLQKEFGSGYSQANLRNFRQLFSLFPIRYALRSELTWTHYRLLMRVENPNAREFYEAEAVRSSWSTRALERQIHVFYYERILASRDRASVEQEAAEKTIPLSMSPRDFVKDPYVLEFLDIKADHILRESDLEQLIMDNLQQFILELGRGFAFVARQQYIRADNEDFFIDLVFYNYILKCFVLVDLKMGKLTHQDVGQMDMYVRMYEDKFKIEGDNPTIGLVLCSEKNEAVVKYSVLNDNQHIFASKYVLYLPTEKELKEELERERHVAELRMSQNK